MEGFDAQEIYSSGNLLGVPDNNDRDQIDLHRIKMQFKEFIRQFHNENFDYKYRYLNYLLVLTIVFLIEIKSGTL